MHWCSECALTGTLVSRAWARRVCVVVVVALGSVDGASCAPVRDPNRVPPAAEFLFSAGDSTYWVRSNADGLRVRSAPILLTQVDGRFYEVFVAEDGVEYDDASFSTSRIWSRELPRTDSVLLFEDTTVRHEATAWKKRHGREEPLSPDDERLSDDPRTIVIDEIEIIDVHGPYLSFRHVLDVDVEVAEPHRHEGRRAVVDVRTGHRATMDSLFGIAESKRIAVAARASLVRLLDSVRTARDERAIAARETLDSFRFSAESFGITDVARAPAIGFLVPGTGAEGDALAIYLPPITTSEPTWWSSVRPTLPEWAPDSSRVRWNRQSYEVSARPLPDGESLNLVLARHGFGPTKEWAIATVASPAFQLVALDMPALNDTMRAALARAFDMSTSLDGVVQRARWPRPSRAVQPLTRAQRILR